MSIVDFKNPPVIEVVLGVQFQRMEGLTNAHLGRFWSEELGANEWPSVEDGDLIPYAQESFESNTGWAPQQFRLGFAAEGGASRLLFRNEQRDRLIQIQGSRFVYNWIRAKDIYPRFDAIESEFFPQFDKFCKYVDTSTQEKVAPDLWEVTYVNHVPRGDLWETPADWYRVVPGLIPAIEPYGKTGFETSVGYWRSEIPPQRGRLHIDVQCRHVGDQPTLVMKLTARGAINEDIDLKAGLRMGHDAIVQSFTDLTSEEAHIKLWKRE